MKRKHKAHAEYNNIVDINSRKPSRPKITPKNPAQEHYMQVLNNEAKHIVFAIGPAGTGKTMLDVQWAIDEYKEGLAENH